MRVFVFVAAIVLTGTVAACDSVATARGATPNGTRLSRAEVDSLRADSIARVRQDSVNRAQPGYVVDSVLPVEEEIRRFGAKVGGTPVTAFEHASKSREELVRRVVRDVASGDSLDLVRAAVSPREFVDLVYPSSQYTHPPYRLSPELAWMTIAGRSASGYRRLLGRRSRQAIQLTGYDCNPKTQVEGENTYWLDCRVKVVSGRDTSTQQWFGSIIERNGRFKIMSFRNQF